MVLGKKRTLCFVVTALMMLQAVASLWGAPHAHDEAAMAQAEKVRHSVLAALSEEHGHSHEDGEPDERVPGHLHGHNPFDHSHETPSVTSGFAVGTPAMFDEWAPSGEGLARTGSPARIDRPPRYT